MEIHPYLRDMLNCMESENFPELFTIMKGSANRMAEITESLESDEDFMLFFAFCSISSSLGTKWSTKTMLEEPISDEFQTYLNAAIEWEFTLHTRALLGEALYTDDFKQWLNAAARWWLPFSMEALSEGLDAMGVMMNEDFLS